MSSILKDCGRVCGFFFTTAVVLCAITPNIQPSPAANPSRPRLPARSLGLHDDASKCPSPNTVVVENDMTLEEVRNKAIAMRRTRAFTPLRDDEIPDEDDLYFSKRNCRARDRLCPCKNRGTRTSAGRGMSAIKGGLEAPPNAFPWLIHIITNESKVCVGFFINYYFALTTASCLAGASYVNITFGSNELGPNRFRGAMTFTIRSHNLYLHDTYSRNGLRNDVGLIQVANGVNEVWTYNHPFVSPVCGALMMPRANSTCFIAGWLHQDPSSSSDATKGRKVHFKKLKVTENYMYLDYMWVGLKNADDADHISGLCAEDQGAPLLCLDYGTVYRVYGTYLVGPDFCKGAVVNRDISVGFIVSFNYNRNWVMQTMNTEIKKNPLVIDVGNAGMVSFSFPRKRP